MPGYRWSFASKCVLTVFSASNYNGCNRNQGAVAIFKHGGDNKNPEIAQFTGEVFGNTKDRYILGLKLMLV